MREEEEEEVQAVLKDLKSIPMEITRRRVLLKPAAINSEGTYSGQVLYR